MYDIMEGHTRLRNMAFRDFVSSRYTEVMESMSGLSASPEIDQRPELCWQESQWMSSFDINGTSGAEHGAAVGKAVAAVNVRMPRKLFVEHGTLWMLATVRFPAIYEDALQWLDNMNRPFEEVIPSGMVQLKPKEVTLGDLHDGGGATSVGFVPHFEWYRNHPSFATSEIYDKENGWPILSRPTTHVGATEATNMDAIFQTTPISEILYSCRHDVRAFRMLPDALDSVMAGGA